MLSGGHIDTIVFSLTRDRCTNVWMTETDITSPKQMPVTGSFMPSEEAPKIFFL